MKQEQPQVATKDSGVVKATKVEITATSADKKPNRLVGFIKDKFANGFDDFKGMFSRKKSINEAYKESKKKKLEKLDIDGSDPLAEKAIILLLLAILQELLEKELTVDEMIDELCKNETLTRELNATMIQSALEKNANLSKELVSAKLEQAINENPNYTQEQKDFYLSKLTDKDFMDKFYDTLGIKEIANKAKSNDELLALVNESFSGNFTKAKEKISESQIEPNTMNSLDDTAMKSMSKDEVVSAIAETLKESKDLADTAGKVRKQD